MIVSRAARIRDLQRGASEIVAWVRAGRAVEIVAPNGRVVGVALPIEAVAGIERIELDRDDRPWDMPAERRVVVARRGRELTGADMAEIGRAIWRRAWLLPMSAAVGVSPSAVRVLRKGGVLPRVVARRLKDLAAAHGIEMVRE